MIDISCICPTYGRPLLLEECIESFLRQDFQGTKELLILNDYDEQELVFEHPEVRIINWNDIPIKTKWREIVNGEIKIYNEKPNGNALPFKFRTLGEKYNAMFEMARGEYLTPFEDDDIFLPHRLSYSYARLEYFRADYHKLPYAYCVYSGKIKEITNNIFFCTGMWTKELALKCLCDAVNSNADQTIEAKLKDKASNYRLSRLIDNKDIYYMYMWGGRTQHLSGYGEGEKALLKAQEDLRKTTIKGRIELHPTWRRNYVQMAEDYIK